jgi:hypothetical protein
MAVADPAATRAVRADDARLLRHAVDVLSWVAVRVLHDVTADDRGIALVPWPIEIGEEIAVDGHPWPLEVVDLVWALSGAKVAAMVKVRRAVLHAV